LLRSNTVFPGADTALHFIRREGDAPSTEPVLVLATDDVEATVQALRDRVFRSSPSRQSRRSSPATQPLPSKTARAIR
jgi:hypothetical protein